MRMRENWRIDVARMKKRMKRKGKRKEDWI
jgi:hypothetical protein